MKLSVQGVTKNYGRKTALEQFSYDFIPGIYGLLGPNGAGKTTLMNLLTDNLKQNEGTILWNDAEIHTLGDSYRSLLGYMPQQQALYAGLTVNRFLFYISALKGLGRQEAKKQIKELLETVNLTSASEMQMSALSGGMKQRVLIAQALLGHPSIVIMDEPTAGLDPEERIRIRNVIADIAEERIVIIATHIVSDIEKIANEVLFLQKGRLLCGGSQSSLCETWAEQLSKMEDKNLQGGVLMSPLEELYLIINESRLV